MSTETKINKEEVEVVIEKKQEVSKKYTVIAIRPTFVVAKNSNGDIKSFASAPERYKVGDIIEL